MPASFVVLGDFDPENPSTIDRMPGGSSEDTVDCWLCQRCATISGKINMHSFAILSGGHAAHRIGSHGHGQACDYYQNGGMQRNGRKRVSTAIWQKPGMSTTWSERWKKIGPSRRSAKPWGKKAEQWLQPFQRYHNCRRPFSNLLSLDDMIVFFAYWFSNGCLHDSGHFYFVHKTIAGKTRGEVWTQTIFCGGSCPKWIPQHRDSCLKALLAQQYPADHFEIIVVDDHSTDDTYKQLRETKGISALSLEKQRKKAACLLWA